MQIEDGQLWITYNGEIYNYIEIREELEALGHRFRTGTDTEVILRAYGQWGSSCVNRFNGMWSFAIYDRRENQLFCSRDRFGIKPFYYFVSPDFFLCVGNQADFAMSGYASSH
jgi:asparagine synthase (glutamine-hydrolysing)